MMRSQSVARSAELDFLRVMAALGVVIVHSSAALFYAYDQRTFWHAANIWDSLCRISVPLFFLLSGALILNPQKDPESAWLRTLGPRLLRLAAPLLVWSVVYAFVIYLQTHASVPRQILHMASAPVMFHLSFVHDMMGVYICLPLLWVLHRAFLKDYHIAYYCFALCFLSYAIASFLSLATLQQLFHSPLVGYSMYFLLGGFLRHAKLNIPYWVGMLMFAVGSCATCLLTYYASSRLGAPSEQYYVYFSFNVVIAATGCFLMIPRLTLSPRPAALLRTISDATFFIYFIHVLVMQLIGMSPLAAYLTPTMGTPLVGIPLYATAVFVISFALSQICRLVPKHRLLFG